MKKLISSLALAALPALAFAAPVAEVATNKGNIEIALDSAKAPKSVANFVAYAKAGHYNGTVFHRVIDGFMIQGGGFDAKLNQKPTRAPIPNEANNGLKNDIGTIAMARTSDPNSATAQFFINVANNDFLNYSSPTPQGAGYAVFGKVTKGMDVVNRIAKARTGSMSGMQDVPFEPIIIQKVTIKP
ncbi:peptidylprolyl isomerase [Chromobacterium phragmitis]|uniref:Peptidyl-prolyl cis-trans isomerase n=1 Tax=Chromobacterium phragmitis TaxID=2202141 RepID=A0A344UF67_9NEIS|nr:peptidylprolyl isomerase [Chromobacterium phragmitis]AXE28591.1 peptidylprolyl isomerase [Chromobacterium phragmitis]AXE33915.1 peptidylprolyl isomerase [Chromobacterium phragmitis]